MNLTRFTLARTTAVCAIVLAHLVLPADTAFAASPTPWDARSEKSWQGEPAQSRSDLPSQDANETEAANRAGTRLYFSFISKSPAPAAPGCSPIPGESYGHLSVNGSPTDRPAEAHADLNLALRGYQPTNAYKGLVDYNGPTDERAPALSTILGNRRTPGITSVYRVYDWNWSSNSRGGLIAWPEVTLIGLGTSPGETIHLPNSGYDIGSGYDALVLYADASRITLKYTREDNVVSGYTIHVENICVDPNLVALYRSLNAGGRRNLPALRAGQAFARARGGEIRVAIRDCGSFTDPRSRKDWW